MIGRIDLQPKEFKVEKTHAYFLEIGNPEDFGTLHLNLIDLGRQIATPASLNAPVARLMIFVSMLRKPFDQLNTLNVSSILLFLPKFMIA